MKGALGPRRASDDEDVALGSDAASPDARVTELLDLYLVAARDGSPLDREAFLAAHPECSDALRVALVGFDFVRRAGDALSTSAARGHEALPSRTLGDFRLVREVGRGGMGVVYEAEQLSLGRRVALKVLPFAATLDERQLQRFKQEAQAAAHLHHTNIVPVYAVGTERGVHYYAMQLVAGRTLAEVIGELRAIAHSRPVSGRARPAARARPGRRLPRAPTKADRPAESSAEARALSPGGTTETTAYCRGVARLGVQAAEALDHAHENGVIHRDIKPANLMVDGRGHLWIADFGLARSRTDVNLTATGAIVGTLRYMSPEQALPRRVPLDHRTDVYSLGVTLLEALTLEPAFPGEEPHRVMQDIALRPPTRPHRLNRAVSTALETILLKAVEKDPELRYATAQEMADDLRRYLDDKPVLARRPPLLDRMTLWARRHRPAVVAAGAILAVAVAALAVSTWRIAGEKRRAEASLEDSRRSAARATASFEKALGAVDRMLTRVGAEELAGVPGLEPVRRKLLEDAVSFFQEFLRHDADDPRVQLDLARALTRLGALHSQLGSFATASQELDRARSLLLQIAPLDGPWSPAFDDIVHLETHRGAALEATDPVSSEATFEGAVALAERNVRERPDEAHGLSCLASTQAAFGASLARVGRYERAAGMLLAAEERQGALVARSPADPVLREGLVNTLKALADLSSSTEPAKAEAYVRKALTHCDAAATGPADSTSFGTRAWLYRKLGYVLLQAGRLEDAERALRTAFEARSRQETEFPHMPRYAADAADCLGALAGALHRLGRHQEGAALDADARSRFERFLERYRGVPELKATCARFIEYSAQERVESGRRGEAAAAFREAVDLRRELVEAAPGRAAPKDDLAATLCAMCAQLGDALTVEESARLAREGVGAAEEALALIGERPKYRHTLGWCWEVLALALDRAGDRSGADAAYRKSAGILRDLASRHPVGASERKELAETLVNWGDLLQGLGRLDEAEGVLSDARGILEGIAPASLRPSDVAENLAKALAAMASVANTRERSDLAEGYQRSCVEIRETLIAPPLRTHERRYALALASRNLGSLLRVNKKANESEASYCRSIEIGGELWRDDPTYLPAARVAANSCELLFKLLHYDLGRSEEAERWLRESVRFWTELATARPEPETRGGVTALRRVLASFLHKAGRGAEGEGESRALAALLRGWAEADPAAYGPPLGLVLTDIAVACSRSGKPLEEVKALEEAIQRHPLYFPAYGFLVSELSDLAAAGVRNPRRAVEVARTATEAVIEKAGAWNLLGMALVCDGQWKAGLAAYEKSRELGYQEDGSDWIYEALALARLGEMEAARDRYDRAVRSLVALKRSEEEHLARRRDETGALLGIPKAR